MKYIILKKDLLITKFADDTASFWKILCKFPKRLTIQLFKASGQTMHVEKSEILALHEQSVLLFRNIAE